MKPRPLYRSLIFWFGILTMSFIGWAWWKSLVTFTTYHSPRAEVRNAMGYVIAIWPPPFPASPGIHSDSTAPDFIRRDYRIHPMPSPAFRKGEAKKGTPVVYLNRQIPEGSKPYFHKVWQDSLAYAPREHRMLMTPHWLLLLIVAAAWIGLLLWRARRQHRAKAMTIPEASS